MRTWIRPLIVFISLVVVPLPAWSVIVQTKDGKEFKGYLVKNDAIQLVMRLHGSNEEKMFFQADIKNIVQTVEFKELEKLKPGQAKGYYEYALTLTGETIDPEARETALRLFLIAAYQDPVAYGFNALIKMSEI